jgi:small neutral amino acid transporter SnatA (MarC family)
VTLPELPVGWHVVIAGAASLGAVLIIIRGLTIGNGGFSGFGSSVSAGVKWGGYLLFLAAIAEAVFAIMALRESGESVSFDRGTPETPPPTTT